MSDKQEAQELTAEEKVAAVQEKTARVVLPPFELKPFGKNQPVTLAMLKKLTQMPIPNGNMGIRQLNAKHVDSLKSAYEQGEKLPPMLLANSTHGVILIAGYHRMQAMRDVLADKLGYDTESDLSKENNEKDKNEFQALLEKTFVTYKPVVAKDPQELVKLAFMDNLTHGLPPTAENRSRFALFLIADAEKRGLKMTQQEAADIVHISRVAIARQIMRDKGTVGITKRASILPADYVPEEEAQEVMEQAERQEMDRKKQADPLQDATLSLFRNLRIINQEMAAKAISTEEITDYMEDIVGNRLTGFTIDRFAFESIAQAIEMLFKTTENK